MIKITKESNRPVKKFKCAHCNCEFESNEYHKTPGSLYANICPIEWCSRTCDEVILKKDIIKKINRRKKK